MSTHTTLELQTGKAARLLKAGQLNVVKAQPGAVYRVVAVHPNMPPPCRTTCWPAARTKTWCCSTAHAFQDDGVTQQGLANVGARGHFELALGGYTGVVIQRSENVGARPGHQDEASGSTRDLGIVLVAMGVVSEDVTSINIKPVTGLTTLKAGVQAPVQGNRRGRCVHHARQVDPGRLCLLGGQQGRRHPQRQRRAPPRDGAIHLGQRAHLCAAAGALSGPRRHWSAVTCPVLSDPLAR